MPFAVFRRHQRKLLAVLAIFAMVAFTLDFSLLRNRFGPGNADPVIVELYGKKIYRSDLQGMLIERSRANRFVSLLSPQFGPQYFGGGNDRALVDALILQHEADALGMPANADLANRWLRQVTGNQVSADVFNRLYREHFSEEVTDEKLLSEIANQLRLREVAGLPGVPELTPLDVYQAYRDQYERVSAFAVPFLVENYVAKIEDPSDAEARAYYDRYKNVLPGRTSETPGFLIPRRVQVEFVMIDGEALSEKIKATLTDKELREVYERRASEFPAEPPGLPYDLFQNDPDATLTPPPDRYLEVKPLVVSTLANERAQEEINRVFGEIKSEAMDRFSERYDEALEENKEAKPAEQKPLPEPGDLLKKAAASHKLAYEKTPLLDQEQAAEYGRIGQSEVGTTALSGGKSFTEAFFDPKAPPYDPTELTDSAGRRFLAWKVQDLPARVPSFDEIRQEVVHAWKLEKARALAEKDARAFAERVRASGGDIKRLAEGAKRLVVTTLPVSKLRPNPMMSQYQMPAPAQPSEIPNIPDAGAALRETLFSLGPKSVAVEPNQAKTAYYVLTLNQTYPVDLSTLYAPFSGFASGLSNEVFTEAYLRRGESWMNSLRAKAGLKPGWIPPDEARTQIASAAG